MIPLYDRETIDEDVHFEGGDENRMDLGMSEKATAQITDFKLLKVIGKGSFGKVNPFCILIHPFLSVYSCILHTH